MAAPDAWAFPSPDGSFERDLAARLRGESLVQVGSGLGPAGGGVMVGPHAPGALHSPSSPRAVAAAAAAAGGAAGWVSGEELPYELRALEAALRGATHQLSDEVRHGVGQGARGRGVGACTAPLPPPTPPIVLPPPCKVAGLHARTLPALASLGAGVSLAGLEAVRWAKLGIKRAEARVTAIKRVGGWVREGGG